MSLSFSLLYRFKDSVVFFNLKLHDEFIVLKGDSTSSHTVCLMEVWSPSIDNGHTLLFATFDWVLFGKLSALLYSFFWKLIIRCNWFVHSQVYVSRTEIVNMEPDEIIRFYMINLPNIMRPCVLNKLFILKLIFTHINSSIFLY